MKNILNIKRGGAIALAVLSSIFYLTALSALAQPTYLPPQGIYIDGSTNVVSVGGSNVFVNVVTPNNTNYFNLSGINQSQADTNLWPKMGITRGRDEGSPSRLLAVESQFNCSAANAGLLTRRWALSTDASHWITNPCPVIEVFTANGTTQVQRATNIDIGAFPFMTLFSQENTNATVYFTNNFIGSAGKLYQ